MKNIFALIAFLFSTSIMAWGQYTVVGKIEYEKKVNVWARYKEYLDDEGNNSWYDEWKARTPQFNVTYFDLSFNREKSIYKPGKELENAGRNNNWDPATDNMVLTDFKTQNVKAVKNVFEQKFFVQDSMRKIEWRVKDEIRTIADYKCFKAVGKICDSVYVVAFYTEDIVAAGGPEMFGGLPGMILELAIPRLHTTWVADKIEITAPEEKDFALPEKGKKVTEKELYETIQHSLKDWGKWAPRYIWLTVL